MSLPRASCLVLPFPGTKSVAYLFTSADRFSCEGHIYILSWADQPPPS